MSNDRVSRYRVARISLFPPQTPGGNARYCLIASTIRNGVPRGQIIVDGIIPNAPAFPTTEELLELFDSAVRQHMLVRE